MRERVALLLMAIAAAVAFAHALWISEVTHDAGIALAYARNRSGWGGSRRDLRCGWMAQHFAHYSGAACAAVAVLVRGRSTERPVRDFGRHPEDAERGLSAQNFAYPTLP